MGSKLLCLSEISFTLQHVQFATQPNLQHMQFVKPVIRNMCILQHVQFVTCVICNKCNLQHMQFETHAICNTCHLQHVQFATHAISNMCNLQHVRFANFFGKHTFLLFLSYLGQIFHKFNDLGHFSTAKTMRF